MKKIVKLTVLLLFTVVAYSNAQKLAHISSNDLLLMMPERKQAETAMQDFAKQLESQMQTMNGEYESKISDFQAKKDMMTDIIRQDKEKEIIDLETRIKNFQQTAQESLQKKEQELLAPMQEKARKAIQDVAKENGYKYVFDSSIGALLYMDASDDIMLLVKKKLNIDAAATVPKPGDNTNAAPKEKPKEQPKK
jgi:outer membrane protein